MPTRRLPLLGFAALLMLGACSSSGATATTTTPASAIVTSVAPTTAAPTTTVSVTPAATAVTANAATAVLVSQALVAQTGGKLSAADATCIATGLLAKYDLNQLAAMQTGTVSAEVVAATAVVIEGCVGAERATEVATMLTGAA